MENIKDFKDLILWQRAMDLVVEVYDLIKKLPKEANYKYYLTTWNNTAMIQTGHSNGESTEDERKVLANTLFYLKQLTNK
uniref:four helix bundle protein n=1 Tax=uncultured Capnocytophaga sp. TaxID=159273 RepID=UPI00261F0AC5